jgi:hypothetical protein
VRVWTLVDAEARINAKINVCPLVSWPLVQSCAIFATAAIEEGLKFACFSCALWPIQSNFHHFELVFGPDCPLALVLTVSVPAFNGAIIIVVPNPPVIVVKLLLCQDFEAF